jgi:hypothetical protein
MQVIFQHDDTPPHFSFHVQEGLCFYTGRSGQITCPPEVLFRVIFEDTLRKLPIQPKLMIFGDALK